VPVRKIGYSAASVGGTTGGAAAAGANVSFRRYQRCNNTTVLVAWIATTATDRYQIQCSANPFTRDIRYAGITSSAVRISELTSDGIVFPSAWNMLELTNTRPEGMKFHATICRYSLPTASTPGSLLKMPTSGP